MISSNYPQFLSSTPLQLGMAQSIPSAQLRNLQSGFSNLSPASSLLSPPSAYPSFSALPPSQALLSTQPTYGGSYAPNFPHASLASPATINLGSLQNMKSFLTTHGYPNMGAPLQQMAANMPPNLGGSSFGGVGQQYLTDPASLSSLSSSSSDTNSDYIPRDALMQGLSDGEISPKDLSVMAQAGVIDPLMLQQLSSDPRYKLALQAVSQPHQLAIKPENPAIASSTHSSPQPKPSSSPSPGKPFTAGEFFNSLNEYALGPALQAQMAYDGLSHLRQMIRSKPAVPVKAGSAFQDAMGTAEGAATKTGSAFAGGAAEMAGKTATETAGVFARGTAGIANVVSGVEKLGVEIGGVAGRLAVATTEEMAGNAAGRLASSMFKIP